ncbi:MAG: ASKHA domain-containing protein [Endomicrobia bacterium]|nr:ASKHA domain-containing protein [Endomicrobiia bacterium]
MKIKIENLNKEIETNNRKSLLEALIENGVNIYASCGGKGICGKCKVKVVSGNYTTLLSQFLSEEDKNQGIVIACKTYPEDDLIVEILKESQGHYVKDIDKGVSVYNDYIERDIISNFSVSSQLEPIIEVIDLNLEVPTLNNFISDKERLLKYIENKKNMNVVLENIEVLRQLPKFLRENRWKGFGVITKRSYANKNYYEVVDLTKNKKIFALAIDIGTTTVAVSLIDMLTLENVKTKSTYNQQIVFGDDIITRIIFSETKDGLSQLQYKIIKTINELVDNILKETGFYQKDIYAVVIAGNTTMNHFFYGIDSSYIRREPYVPAAVDFPIVKAKDIGLMINPNAIIFSIPSVASYVGGDIVGGVVSCNIDMEEDVCVLLDLGTNGEIVVGNREFIISAACSCGPAFEGVGITNGVRATSGAIEDITIKDSSVVYKTIDNLKPIGICGSGLIDIPAELLKAGIIDKSGRFIRDVDEKFKQRVRINENGEYEFVVETKDKTDISKDIVITEPDIQNILRSKGSIFHGLYTLLKYLDLSFSDIKKFYLSGGFGSFLNIKKAQILGLLPELEEDKFIVAGNTSLLGAKLFLISEKVRERMYEVEKKMTYIDLSSLPAYMNDYTSTLFIPHTDISLFPKIAEQLKGGKG